MTSIEQEMLQDVYRVFRKLAAKYLRKRSPDQSQRMQQARAQQMQQQVEALREQEFRALIEDLQNERRQNPEFAAAIDGLPDDQRTQRLETEARWQQDQRDRMDADPNLTPEDIQREVEENRDLENNGLDDREDREREAEDFERNVVDPNGNGEIDAVEEREAEQADRDAEQTREREQERNEEARETEEARGGDALPAVAAAGAGAVAAEEVADELEDQHRDEALEDQQTEVLNDDGTTPEVIGETEAERDARLAEPEAAQDNRILDEDGAAPAVIGEDAHQAGLEQDGAERERREGQGELGEAGPQPGLPTGGDQAAAADQETQNEQRGPDYVETTLEQARSEQNGQSGQGEQNGQSQMPQDEMDRLRGLQDGQANAADATRSRTGEPVEAGAGGKNPGARAAELRSDKGSKRDGPGIGE
jgi:hypothetical protein